MVVARITVWKFKSGQREAAIGVLEEAKKQARKIDGYSGHLFLLPSEEPDTEIVVSLWENEEVYQASMQSLLQEVSQNLDKYIVSPPDVMKYTVFSAEVEAVKPELVKPA
ncbi:putative quinol monooxygenase [Methanoculleus sp.]|jgi:heme-degrading monooxygenase HmoA|uniref:putative quinol monooxygenase n=1 Tax=Methanoculleus sp. TaxID=90427 RepID=UPI001BD56E8C|nr:antibiotic biosynthesis monooxygenase family protein [Methanoculleus sp.]